MTGFKTVTIGKPRNRILGQLHGQSVLERRSKDKLYGEGELYATDVLLKEETKLKGGLQASSGRLKAWSSGRVGHGREEACHDTYRNINFITDAA